jgi:peptide chain release factor subunit 1
VPTALLEDQIRRLSQFENPSALPVISLYLNAQADQHGKDRFGPFLRKELSALAKTYDARSDARTSFDRDVTKIENFVAQQLDPSTNSVAIFACAGANDFFETIQLKAPLEQHEIYVDSFAHLYTLARLNDQYRRYAAVVVNSNSAVIFVFGLGETLNTEKVDGVKAKRSQVGGWSQARYQRHIDNFQLHHAKEVVSVLERVAAQENINHIVLAGEEETLPVVRDHLPPALKEKVLDIVRLDAATPEQEVMQATMEVMRRSDAKTDAEHVEHVIGDFRAHGLAAVGAEDVLSALDRAQVDEVLVSATKDALSATDEPHRVKSSESESQRNSNGVADEIVRKAAQTAATVRFIEDANLLAGVGGVAARLRYRL